MKDHSAPPAWYQSQSVLPPCAFWYASMLNLVPSLSVFVTPRSVRLRGFPNLRSHMFAPAHTPARA